MWIWMLNMMLMGLALGLVLSDHMSKGSLQLVVQRATYNEPGARVQVWGVQVKSRATA